MNETELQERHRRMQNARARARRPDALLYEEQLVEEGLDPKRWSPERKSLRRRGAFHPPRPGAPPEP